MRLLGLALLTSCFGDPDLGGQEGSAHNPEADADTDADTDADSDTDADTDADTDVDPGLSGIERFRFHAGGGSRAAEVLNCELYFDLSGVAVSELCEGCTFGFDVTYTLDTAQSVDDGTCESLGYTAGFGGVYAYDPDLDGYGPAWLRAYYGSWYASGAAVLKDSTLTYTYTSGDPEQYYTYERLGNTIIK